MINKENEDSSDEDEKAKSLKSGFKFSKNKTKSDEKSDDDAKIEEEKVPKGILIKFWKVVFILHSIFVFQKIIITNT